MKKEKSFPVTSLVILAVFGLLCFLGGFLSSNITNKKKLSAAQARLSECENKFLSFSKYVIANSESAVKVLDGISSAWHEAAKRGVDFNDTMETFLEDNKSAISNLKLTNDLIEIQSSDLKKYKKESQDEFEVVMELYDIYKKIYALGMNPAGSLEGFDSNKEDLFGLYAQAQSKVFVFMPELKKSMAEPVSVAQAEIPAAQSNVPAAQAKAVDAPAPAAVQAAAPVVEKIKTVAIEQRERLTFDQRIKKISKDMTYREVESMAGVPRDKKKDSQNREVWIYPSEKIGFRNVVYFASGKVLQSKNLPINSQLD